MPDAESMNGPGAAREGGDYAVFQGYLKAAQEGGANAQHDVGLLYAAGDGVAQDFGEALNWWRKAAAQGNAAAHYNIGSLYAEGWGVAVNKEEAISHCRQAAERGHPGAQGNLGHRYLEGELAEAAQAHMLFDRAVAGYQQMVNSGDDVQKLLDDAIRARRRARLPVLKMRCVMFFASVGRSKSKKLYVAAFLGNVDLAKRLVAGGPT